MLPALAGRSLLVLRSAMRHGACSSRRRTCCVSCHVICSKSLCRKSSSALYPLELSGTTVTSCSRFICDWFRPSAFDHALARSGDIGSARLRPGTCPAEARGSGGAQKMSNAASKVSMSSFRLTKTERRALRKSIWLRSSTWFRARVASVSRRGPASMPASCSSRAKAPSRGRRSTELGSGTSGLLDHGGDLFPYLLEVFLVRQCRPQSRIDEGGVDSRRAQRRQRPRPVQRLSDSGHLVEVHASQPLNQRRHLTREALGGLRRACPNNLDLFLEVRIVDPVIKAPALQGIVHLAGPVGGDDHERRLLRLDGSDLRDRHLEVRQQFQQEGLELLVGAVDLVDEQDRRRGVVVVDGVQQRPPQEELRAEDLALCGTPIVLLAQQADVQKLARIIPFVDGVGEVDALVALQADQAGAQHIGHDLGRLRLADAGLALDEQRLFELEGQEDGGREPAVADVAPLAQARLDLVDRKRSRVHGRKDYRPRRTNAAGSGKRPINYPACSIALLVSTLARCFLYSGLARRSPEGFSPSDACWAASSGLAPLCNASSTAFARTGVGPTLVRPMRQPPSSFWAAAPTIAQSNSRRRNLMYLCGPFATGKTISVTISSAASGVVKMSLKKSLAGIVRWLVTMSASSINAMVG